jgi:ABC-2 type transport system ATP-binding protein
MFSLELTPALDSAMGNGHWRSAVYALWDSIFAVGLCLGLIPLFRRRFGKRSRFGEFLSRQSYAVYVIHVPIIVFLTYGLRGIELAPLAKFGLASAIAVPVCFAGAYLLGRIPLLKRILGSGRSGSGVRSGGTGNTLDVESVPEGETVIAIDGLVKSYGDITAVNGLAFDIKKGELFGLLGPNGAGKTTTISILCGLLAPSAGSAQVGGLDISDDMPTIKQGIGVCPQEAAVYEFLTGRENIELFGTLHGMDRRSVKERTDALLEQVDFAEAAGRRAKGYSGGMTRQLNLLMALVSDPDIVFLDEPTVGMDARARRRTWDYIASLKEQGKTIILTTHYIEEAESLSDRVGIIDYGELIDLGTPEELMQKHESKDLEEVFLKITGRRIAEGS